MSNLKRESRNDNVPTNGKTPFGDLAIRQCLRVARSCSFTSLRVDGLDFGERHAGGDLRAPPGTLPISGMAFMYLLMSLFHLSP